MTAVSSSMIPSGSQRDFATDTVRRFFVSQLDLKMRTYNQCLIINFIQYGFPVDRYDTFSGMNPRSGGRRGRCDGKNPYHKSRHLPMLIKTQFIIK